MLKRIGSVSILTCAILLLASTSALSSTPVERNGASAVGVEPAAGPTGPTTAGGATTGDDDAPFIDVQTTATKTIGSPAEKPERSNILRALRTYEAYLSAYMAKLSLMNYWGALR